MKTCPKCNTSLDDDSVFCYNCGASLGEEPAEEPSSNNARPQSDFGAGPGGGSTVPPYGGQGGYNPYGGVPQGGPQAGPQNGYPPYGGQPGGPGGYNPPPYQPPAPAPTDHTAEFDPGDISTNKILAMVPYLLGSIGLIVALLAMHESEYVGFHVRQALKLTVVNALLGIVSVLLCWTFIVPIAGIICMVIVFVLRIIAFVQVCMGQAKEPAIISSLGFLK